MKVSFYLGTHLSCWTKAFLYFFTKLTINTYSKDVVGQNDR